MRMKCLRVSKEAYDSMLSKQETRSAGRKAIKVRPQLAPTAAVDKAAENLVVDLT
jgi:hypothetical protein